MNQQAPKPPPHDDDRRLVWLDADVYSALARAAAARGLTVDALVDELLAGVGTEVA